jgi:adenosine/AMP kinase
MEADAGMDIKALHVDIPEATNVIIGQSHFIKTVEDLYEAIVNSAPQIRFGIAFNEASGPCLTRKDGNDADLVDRAVETAQHIGAGHLFVICMQDGFPIQILPAVRETREVVRIFCATANPLEVIVGETEQGRGVLGVIDGFQPKGIEGDRETRDRIALMRKFGYKR